MIPQIVFYLKNIDELDHEHHQNIILTIHMMILIHLIIILLNILNGIVIQVLEFEILNVMIINGACSTCRIVIKW